MLPIQSNMFMNVKFRNNSSSKVQDVWHFFLLVLIPFISSHMHAQTKPCEPEIKIHVKKETDDLGNVIRYDSVYFYSWNGNNKLDLNIDSIVIEIERSFKRNSFFEGFDQFYFCLPKMNTYIKPVNPQLIDELFNKHFKSDSAELSKGIKEFFKFDPIEDIDQIIKDQKKMIDEFKRMFFSPAKDSLNKANKKKHSSAELIAL